MEKSTKTNIIIIVMLIVATGLITFCLPGKTFQGYTYTQGKPWGYAMLTAPFDIPIEYDSATAHRITDSINAHFVKIYRNDFAVVSKKLSGLNKALEKPGIGADTRQAIVMKVSRLYDDGIVDNETYDMIVKGEMPEVRILDNKVANVVSTQKMNSVREAYAYLDSILTSSSFKNAMAAASVYSYLTPNLQYDSVETKKLLDDAYQKALAPQGIVQTGESIIFPGNVVTPEKFSILQTYERMMRQRQMHTSGIDYSILGQLTFVGIMMMVLYYFMRLMRPRTFRNRRKMIFLISFTTLFVIIVEVVIAFRPNYIYLIPFALLPIIITTFTDTRTSFFLHIVVVVLCSLVAKDQAEFIILQFMAGNIAIVSIKELSRRSQLARCAFFIFLMYSLMYAALYVMREGNMQNIFMGGSWHIFVMFVINCAVLSFAYLLIFLIEKIFGFTSTVTLVELSDINDSLTPEQSARIVINHVTDGLKRADKARLPQVISDFITQHHGKGIAKYFYAMSCKAHPDVPIDSSLYTYPGPNPQSKEAAIVMMADACEAATKSLVNPDEKAVSNIVNKIIDEQIVTGLLSEAPISFSDVGIIKQTFIERLRSFYHMRVSYPDDIKPIAQQEEIDEDDESQIPD